MQKNCSILEKKKKKKKKALNKQQFINLILLQSTKMSFVHSPHFANGKISKLIWEHENHMLKFDSCDQITEIC